MKRHYQILKNKSGFTMVEVLVTVVILSIGLLGMAGIQIQGLRGTTSSTVRSTATILANDIAERIRMNVDELATYSNVTIGGVDENGDANFSCDAPQLCVATQGNADIAECSTTQMANFDLFEFACGPANTTNAQNFQAGGVQNLLPNGGATINCIPAACTPGSQVVINISWDETNTAPGSQQQGQNLPKNLTMTFIP